MERKRKADRFNGLSEEEIKKHTLKDYLQSHLDLVFLGINPSLMAAYKGRYYAGPGNHFYKLLHESGLVPRFINFDEDANLLDYKIGLTNIVARATRSSADLTAQEIREGCKIMVDKIIYFKPKIVIFNGRCIYDIFAEKMKKNNFQFGLQSEKIGDSAVWVVPSSSARCSNFPRMEDKLPFYQAIKKHLMFLNGVIENVDFNEFYFKSQPRSKTNNAKFVITEILGGSPNERDDNESEENSECISKKELDSVSPHFATKIDCQVENLDFVNLIKSKLSKKKDDNINCEEKNEEKPMKKLKFGNLMSRKK